MLVFLSFYLCLYSLGNTYFFLFFLFCFYKDSYSYSNTHVYLF